MVGVPVGQDQRAQRLVGPRFNVFDDLLRHHRRVAAVDQNNAVVVKNDGRVTDHGYARHVDAPRQHDVVRELLEGQLEGIVWVVRGARRDD